MRIKNELSRIVTNLSNLNRELVLYGLSVVWGMSYELSVPGSYCGAIQLKVQ